LKTISKIIPPNTNTFNKIFVEKIIDDDDVEQLIKLYRNLKSQNAHQDYNLFDLKKANVPSEFRKISPIDKLYKFSEKKYITACYFLEYNKDSFTRTHSDNGSNITIVTILDTKDLVGGESLILSPYNKKPRPKTSYANRTEKESKTPPYGKNIIPKIVKCKDGESLIYGKELNHGVCQVESGSRLVFITWFDDEKRK